MTKDAWKKILRNLSIILIGVLAVAFIFAICFAFYVSIFIHLYKLKLLSAAWCIGLLLSLTVVTTILFFVLLYLNNKSEKENKLVFYIKKNMPKIILGILITVIFSCSIRYELLWTASEAKEVLTIVWTMFGIAIAIFLVWQIVVLNFLKNKVPQEINSQDYRMKYMGLLEKQSFTSNVESRFSTVIYLSINLLLLIFTTTDIYILKNAEHLFVQNMLICTFYFCSNALVLLFFDILKPIRQNKNELITKGRVSYSELNNTKQIALAQTVSEILIKFVDKVDEFNDEQKQKLKECTNKVLKEIIQKRQEKMYNTKDLTEINAAKAKEKKNA